MVIYGVALLAFCMLSGTFLGQLLGHWLGVEANIGGVGIAMLMLIVLANFRSDRFSLSPPTASGITFWNAMYIPIMVAMAARQNVVEALSSGWLAISAGVAAVVASFLLIPVLKRMVPAGSHD